MLFDYIRVLLFTETNASLAGHWPEYCEQLNVHL